MTLCLMFDYFSDGVLGIDSVVSQSASTFTANGHHQVYLEELSCTAARTVVCLTQR